MELKNRVLAVLGEWEERRRVLEPFCKDGASSERTLARLELAHLRQSDRRLRGSLRSEEEPLLLLLRDRIRRLEQVLYPNLVLRLFYRLKDALIDGPAYLRGRAAARSANMEQLKAQLKSAGLHPGSGRLEEHLDPEQRSVHIPAGYQLDRETRLDLSLEFEQDGDERFRLRFLDGRLSRKGELIRAHHFEISEWPDLKVREVLALLEGKALIQQFTDVYGQQNQRWTELGPDGLRHYDPEHPFDIKAALEAMPEIIRTEGSVQELEKGLRIVTQWEQDGQKQHIYVQADPADRTVRLFDAAQQPTTVQHLSKARKKGQRI